MAPTHNATQQQAPAPLPQTEILSTEKRLQPVERKINENSFTFILTPKDTVDPADWDESWFANYE